MTTATTLTAPEPIPVERAQVARVIEEMLDGLRYGAIQITVHDGRVVQIDRTERRRLDRGDTSSERRS